MINEIYNLAAQSHVHVSFETPKYTANADTLGTLRILEAVKFLGLESKNKNISSIYIWTNDNG
ncbi:MAG: GDP-mannose 4,6-dehydratase [Campylobacter lanienae]|nr:GDP-mannose 4,6-dehydratase [Campylobacter lanienae]